MRVTGLDHVVLTVRNLRVTLAWYERVFGLEPVAFGEGRHLLRFGSQALKLHEAGREFLPHAERPTPGSADLCFMTDVPLTVVLEHLAACGVTIEEGPTERMGGGGPIRSVYVRDPDGNMVEVANPV